MNAIGKVRVLGPLALHVDGFRSELSRLGYALGTAENHVRVMAHLSQWMTDEGLGLSELSQDRAEQFIAVLRTQWKRPPTGRTLAPLLCWLRELRVVPVTNMLRSTASCCRARSASVSRRQRWLPARLRFRLQRLWPGWRGRRDDSTGRRHAHGQRLLWDQEGMLAPPTDQKLVLSLRVDSLRESQSHQ
jgi:hypothetical protein